MSVLTLVRHGQASFDAEDYDQLSASGMQQASRLGRYWADQRLPVSVVCTGPGVRHMHTAELVGIDYRRSGLHWPDPVVLNDLDEYDLDGLFGRFAPRLAAENPDFAKLQETCRRSAGTPQRLRDFQKMFESLVYHWQTAEPGDGVESWPAFQGRVERFIRSTQEHTPQGCRVVAFTSGGFISGAIQCALGVSNQTARELNWRIRNISLTEFLFTAGRFSLDSFNMTPHLSDPAMCTYR
jgi:broad specificity phosphatase PhoE